MTAEKSIGHNEANDLKNKIQHLIGRHNVLCRVEEVFETDHIVNAYYTKAREEVLDSGNQSYATMLVLAIKEMAEFIKENIDAPETEKEELYATIRELRKENRILKERLNNVKDIMNSYEKG